MGQIVLQFAGSISFGGEVIEWYDHGRFAHVDIVLPDDMLLGARNEAMTVDGMNIPAGVQIRPANYLSTDTPVFKVTILCQDSVANKFHDFVLSQVGKPYDNEAIIGFIVGRNWMEPDSWFCSELAAAGLVQSGYLLPLSAPANKIAPDDLLLVLSADILLNLPPL